MSNPRLGPRASHRHPGCLHYCACYTPQTTDCRRCQSENYNAAMARTYYEDSLSVEALLERRA